MANSKITARLNAVLNGSQNYLDCSAPTVSSTWLSWALPSWISSRFPKPYEIWRDPQWWCLKEQVERGNWGHSVVPVSVL